MVQVVFEGIDRMNRPVFKSLTSVSRYGSLDKLFDHSDTEETVLDFVVASDLVFFGNSKDCEPDGDDPIYPIEIIKSGNV